MSSCMQLLNKGGLLRYSKKNLYVKIMHAHMCSPFLLNIWLWHLDHHAHLTSQSFFLQITLYAEHVTSKLGVIKELMVKTYFMQKQFRIDVDEWM